MLTTKAAPISLEAFLERPAIALSGLRGISSRKKITAKTGRIQANLVFFLKTHILATGQGGEVYVETPCRTVGRVRCPDVAYLTPVSVAVNELIA